MCIRDRMYEYVALSIRRFFGDVNFWENFVISALVRNAPIACLLYTSDAADERSSVDLGGRRIIKKKTSGSTTGLLVRYTKALSFAIEDSVYCTEHEGGI